MSKEALVAVLLLSPLIGFIINGFGFRRLSAYTSGIIASGAAVLSFICSFVLFLNLKNMPANAQEISVKFFNWIDVGSFHVKAAFLVDPISVIMILVVAGVGSLIHIYSIGYMSHDERPAKYFSYLNLFLFNMLVLVLADNLLVMFVGWEGVGLCSYLLIGFWFKEEEKSVAGMKAFIVNRIGDAGFLLGIFIIFVTFGTVHFADLQTTLMQTIGESANGWLFQLITWSCICLFIGATGKSAQIPLYIWLPDAMAGPTPVSALIHAATMVTAGVYMVVRLSFLFILSPTAMFIIACVGAATLLISAIIGMTQWDIKKILAYSTVSQLGYMFLATGVGAFGVAMFHLMTHAFFKALMFLGSGSVIHALNGEQDIRKMGGLRKYLPITYWTFMMGWLAIIGIPPLAGFFSKDEILWRALSSKFGNPTFCLVGLIGAALTSFYMTRLMSLTFWGQSRVDKKIHPHESPFTMTIPLIILAVLSVVGGWIGIPHIFPGHVTNYFEVWLAAKVPVVGTREYVSTIMEWSLIGVSVSIAGISAWLAFNFYTAKEDKVTPIVVRFKKVHQIIYNKYYVDEFYQLIIVNPLVRGAKFLWVFVDVKIVDKATYFISDLVRGTGAAARMLQTGNLQIYAMYVAMGMAFVICYILMR